MQMSGLYMIKRGEQLNVRLVGFVIHMATHPFWAPPWKTQHGTLSCFCLFKDMLERTEASLKFDLQSERVILQEVRVQ